MVKFGKWQVVKSGKDGRSWVLWVTSLCQKHNIGTKTGEKSINFAYFKSLGNLYSYQSLPCQNNEKIQDNRYHLVTVFYRKGKTNQLYYNCMKKYDKSIKII